jgi:3-dehydroquinate synthase
MVGYAAATAHRGLRLIRIPTTVMAQADASIGVKNGVNAFGKKNFVGTFHPPWAVLNDFSFLSTLSHRDWISGIAEAIKVALIKDPPFFDFLEKHAVSLGNRAEDIMREVIHRCAALHLRHISTCGDPFELGSSRPLDFGHWAAHKLEQLTCYRMRHGEAVALGMAIDATYSYLSGLLSKNDWRRIMSILSNIGFDLLSPDLDRGESILEGIEEFREHLGGRLTILLLKGIGETLEVHEMDSEIVRASIALLKSLPSNSVENGQPSEQVL